MVLVCLRAGMPGPLKPYGPAFAVEPVRHGYTPTSVGPHLRLGGAR